MRLHPKKMYRSMRESPRPWLFLGLALLGVTVFLRIAGALFFDSNPTGDPEAALLDGAVGRWVVSHRSPMLTQAMTDLTALGSVSVITLFVLVGLSLLLAWRDFWGVLYLGLTVLGGGAWSTGLKALFGRERPAAEEHLVQVFSPSFPSGHSFSAAALYCALAFLAARHAGSWRLEAFLYVLAGGTVALVGVSRIYLGVHYATDVLAGISAGAAWAFLLGAAFTWLSGGQWPKPSSASS